MICDSDPFVAFLKGQKKSHRRWPFAYGHCAAGRRKKYGSASPSYRAIARKRLQSSKKLLRVLGYPTPKKLLAICDGLKLLALNRQRKLNAIMLDRLATGGPLWGPKQQHLTLDEMQQKLFLLQEENLNKSTEIADLNTLSTQLSMESAPLMERLQELKAKLPLIEEKISEKRSRERTKEIAKAQTELLRVKRELDLRNRVHQIQNNKLQSLQHQLQEKHELLMERQEQLQTLKTVAKKQNNHEMTMVSKIGEQHSDHTLSMETSFNSSTASNKDRLMTPEATLQAKKISSSSKKRHASIFEERTKHLVEEEGLAFRSSAVMQLQQDSDHSPPGRKSTSGGGAKKQLDFSTASKRETSPEPTSCDEPEERMQNQVSMEASNINPSVTEVLLSEVMSHLDKMEEPEISVHDTPTSSTYPSKQPVPKGKGGKKVRFTPESIVMAVAMEGELEMLKQCVKELGSCSLTSDKGATCLHHAVCSGSMDMVQYLVEMECDVNAQDIDGWTPLHCATAFSNLEIITYLLNSGSSLFLTTKDGDTPVNIAIEECNLKQDTITQKCLQQLLYVQNTLGVANKGTVYALFSRKAADSKELTFHEGEQLRIVKKSEGDDQWWCVAENARKKRGLVPLNFMGLKRRHQIIL